MNSATVSPFNRRITTAVVAIESDPSACTMRWSMLLTTVSVRREVPSMRFATPSRNEGAEHRINRRDASRFEEFLAVDPKDTGGTMRSAGKARRVRPQNR